MRAKQPDAISDQLRQAIAAAEISLCELARRIGLDKGGLSRFMHRKSGLSVPNIDRIGRELGLELRPRKGPAKRQTKTKGR
jgi:transcriptional regulator with XRE-family HTH domain